MISNLGYQFGMRQRAARVKLTFRLPKQFSPVLLDPWIQEALEADIKSYQPIFLEKPSTGEIFEEYLVRFLFITTILLQDIKVPVFERVAIVSVGAHPEKPGHFLADFWFPVVDNFHPNVLNAWLVISGNFIERVISCNNNQESLEIIYQEFHKEYVLPWFNNQSGGKSRIPILQAAFEMGIPFTQCGHSLFVLGWGAQARLFDGSSNSLDSAIGAQTSHNKNDALELMRFSGIPIPKGVSVRNDAKVSIDKLNQLRLPLVLKPVDKDRGEGVTLGVVDENSFQEAFAKASNISKGVLIEEQVSGVCHRILVNDGKVIFVVKRNPRSMTGDGKSTLQQLVDNANSVIRKKIPQKRLPLYTMDTLAMSCLAEAGVGVNTIAKAGQKLVLRPAQSAEWGGDPEVVTENLHPDNAQLAIRVATLFGLSCAGVDFISLDIGVPWHKNNAVINEVNYKPVVGRTHEYQRIGARSYLSNVFKLNGKIPIEIYVGGALASQARERYDQLIKNRHNCYMCTPVDIFDNNLRLVVFLNTNSIVEDLPRLQTNQQVEALVIHIVDPEVWLKNGIPFEYITRVLSSIDKEYSVAQQDLVVRLESYLTKDFSTIN